MNRGGVTIRSKSTSRRLLVVLVAICAMNITVFAHHGWSSYDASKVLNFTGVIREQQCRLPVGPSNRLERDSRTVQDSNGRHLHPRLAKAERPLG